MNKYLIHRYLHNAVAGLALLTLVVLSLYDFHGTFCTFCKKHEQEIGPATPMILTYVLGLAYACLFYCEIQMHKRKGAQGFRIVLHMVTLIIALLPHILAMLSEHEKPAIVPASVQEAGIINIEMAIALVLFVSIEAVLSYLVWHINNPPRRRRGP